MFAPPVAYCGILIAAWSWSRSEAARFVADDVGEVESADVGGEVGERKVSGTGSRE